MSVTFKPSTNKLTQCSLGLSLPRYALCISQYTGVVVSGVSGDFPAPEVMHFMSTSQNKWGQEGGRDHSDRAAVWGMAEKS